MIASMLLFSVEELLGLPVLKLSPVLALLAGLMFFAKAGISLTLKLSIINFEFETPSFFEE